MSIDRRLWTEKFNKNSFPTWTCSTCNAGLLELQQNTLNNIETGESKRNKTHEAWDPEWIRYRFVALLICNNKACADCVTLTGSGDLVEIYYTEYGQHQQDWLDFFTAEYFRPAPQIFRIPDKTPDKIKEEILQSFCIFLSDSNAAGNRVRTCVEMILNHQKVIKTKIIRTRREKLTLHARIKEFEKKNKDLGENLLAIKWLGNAASHSSGLVVDDIFDAYEILHHVLNEMYDNRSKRIKSLTKNINKKKGKLSK